MAKTYYTTSEVARLLSVSADTVLKWVRAGKILSYRTPGGHSRIPIEAVKALLPDKSKVCRPARLEMDFPTYKYCWEFNAGPDGAKRECLECVAYRSNGRRCYEMRAIPEQFGHLKLFCKNACDECEYYRQTHSQSLAVLVISRNMEWLEQLGKQADETDVRLAGATNEYQCSSTIAQFRPDFAVVDYGFGTTRTRDICRNIIQDARLPLTRIILTSRAPRMTDYCEDELFGWIARPFAFDQLLKMIYGPQREMEITDS
ncbi:MAG: helix-turn-helix domain-containing protein [Candidatus Zixiibacteriota bacterium]